MDRGADVVHEPWFGQLGRSAASTGRRPGFEDRDLDASLSEHNRRGEPVGAGPNNNCSFSHDSRIRRSPLNDDRFEDVDHRNAAS